VNLLIDIGNSRIKWCLHDNSENKFVSIGAMFHDKSALDELFCEHWNHLASPSRVLVSNVSGSDIAEKLDAWIKKAWQINTEYVKSEAHSYGLSNAYLDTSKLGVDRWMAIVAAWHRYQSYQEDICVVDCGTAMTIDGISKSGQHLGGLIIPGYTMMQEVLANNTSDINTIRTTSSSFNFSNSTEQAVNSGCYLAMLATIDRVVTLMKNDADGQVRCIITGGNAELVIEDLADEFEYDPNLVLHGLTIFSGQAQ
jgi:type III pantothenate kinase